ncbi:hypothetical protein HYC85_026321 [Camellia sinensis]|uniref:Uncharacterized protein n=1 Tax=Camellia sinensis TaxID=4442 RepID=A0A7J7G3C0_CAMSI|nr:hypothetical protein HYC85_026321 [Camellia sinensis]
MIIRERGDKGRIGGGGRWDGKSGGERWREEKRGGHMVVVVIRDEQRIYRSAKTD